jgi:acyl carrier protein
VTEREEIFALIASETGLEEATLDGKWSLAELGATSFATMRLIIGLEERFELEFPLEDMQALLRGPAREIPAILERARSSAP